MHRGIDAAALGHALAPAARLRQAGTLQGEKAARDQLHRQMLQAAEKARLHPFYRAGNFNAIVAREQLLHGEPHFDLGEWPTHTEMRAGAKADMGIRVTGDIERLGSLAGCLIAIAEAVEDRADQDCRTLLNGFQRTWHEGRCDYLAQLVAARGSGGQDIEANAHRFAGRGRHRFVDHAAVVWNFSMGAGYGKAQNSYYKIIECTHKSEFSTGGKTCATLRRQ